MDFRSFWRRRDIRLFALALPIASLGLFWIVPLAGLAGLILSFLLLVARYDNAAGTWLPIAVLFVIVLLVAGLLIGGLAYIHAVISGR